MSPDTRVCRDRIEIYQRAIPNNSYVARCVTDLDSVFYIFECSFFLCDNHLVLVGKRKYSNRVKDANDNVIGVAHDEVEARKRLYEICRTEARTIRAMVVQSYNGVSRRSGLDDLIKESDMVIQETGIPVTPSRILGETSEPKV